MVYGNWIRSRYLGHLSHSQHLHRIVKVRVDINKEYMASSTINSAFNRQYDFLRIMAVDLASSPLELPKKTGITWKESSEMRVSGSSDCLKAATCLFPYHLESGKDMEIVRVMPSWNNFQKIRLIPDVV